MPSVIVAVAETVMRAQINRGNFSAGGGQGRRCGPRTGVGSRLCAGNVEGIAGDQADGAGIHWNRGTRQIAVDVEKRDAGGRSSALRTAVQDVGGRTVAAESSPRPDDRKEDFERPGAGSALVPTELGVKTVTVSGGCPEPACGCRYGFAPGNERPGSEPWQKLRFRKDSAR